jgi:hypothetical protein
VPNWQTFDALELKLFSPAYRARRTAYAFCQMAAPSALDSIR